MSPDAPDLGRTLLDRGLITKEEHDEAVQAQKATGVPLADIFVQKSFLSRLQVEDALAALDKRVRTCPRCNQPVYVARVTAEGERCPRCRSALEWRAVAASPQIAEVESIVQLTKDDLPGDVLAARTVPTRLFGKYILLDELGKGGSGVVMKAWDTMMGEYVALKFIREPRSVPDSAEEAQKQRQTQIMDLLQEARSALRLRHEHIVAIRDVGRINQQFYISMEYIEGDTLADHVRAAQTRGRLSSLYEDPAFYLRALLNVANAIYYAHTFPKPIVHCDLKPSNILISVAGNAYVMDFGLARALDVPRADEAIVRGTPAYMAPEQLTGRSEDIGVWTDVYGMGAILYELLTGRPMFTGETPEILARTMRDPPERPSDVVRQTGEGRRRDTTQILARLSKLEAVCLRCLAKDPRDRYASLRDIAEELEAVLARLETPGDAESDVVSHELREAQERAEFRRLDDSITQFDLAGALKEADRLGKKIVDTKGRHWIADRRQQVALLEQFRDRLVERLNQQRPKLAVLNILRGSLPRVEVLKATPAKLVVFHAEKPMELAWSSLVPAQVVALAEAVSLNAPEDRLALGIFCRRARLAEQSAKLLTSLMGTPLESAARQVMESGVE